MVKEKKLKPSKELPLGFVDRKEQELLIRDFIISNIKEVMIKYGFQYLETPSFEYTDSIGKFLPDKERPEEGVFSFKDEKKWLSLRYDLTAPLARYVAKNYLELPKPFKRYQLGTVWRNEKPGPGRFREFLQFDADYVGTKNLQADAELCVLISEILEKCGLDKSDYTVKISSRKFTDKLFEQLKIKSKDQISTTLRVLDKIDRLGWGEAKKLLGEGRKDKSGDYTKGANLKSDQIKIIENALKSKHLIVKTF
jgi:histidyl-tRNA synthetase